MPLILYMKFKIKPLKLILPFILVACSPNFNWREVHETNYIIYFPSKPSTYHKNINIDNKKYILYMQAANSGDSDALFGIAYIKHENINSHYLINNLQREWCKNGILIKNNITNVLTCNWSNGKYNKIMQSKWINTNKYIYQLSIIYDASYKENFKHIQSLNENIDFFFNSFKPLN